jgi:hypothetical protein
VIPDHAFHNYSYHNGAFGERTLHFSINETRQTQKPNKLNKPN